jgi:hypothetical protein
MWPLERGGGEPRHLGDGGGDAHLLMAVEAQGLGDVPAPLPRVHHVLSGAQVGLEEGDAQGEPLEADARATRTVTSSLPGTKSRYSTPATTLGWRERSPG